MAMLRNIVAQEEAKCFCSYPMYRPVHNLAVTSLKYILRTQGNLIYNVREGIIFTSEIEEQKYLVRGTEYFGGKIFPNR